MDNNSDFKNLVDSTRQEKTELTEKQKAEVQKNEAVKQTSDTNGQKGEAKITAHIDNYEQYTGMPLAIKIGLVFVVIIFIAIAVIMTNSNMFEKSTSTIITGTYTGEYNANEIATGSNNVTHYNETTYNSLNASSYLPKNPDEAYTLLEPIFKQYGYDFSTWERENYEGGSFILTGPNHNAPNHKQYVWKSTNLVRFEINNSIWMEIMFNDNMKVEYCDIICYTNSNEWEGMLYNLIDAFISNCPSDIVLSSDYMKSDFPNKYHDVAFAYNTIHQAEWNKSDLNYVVAKSDEPYYQLRAILRTPESDYFR